jgi:hypothetical protein
MNKRMTAVVTKSLPVDGKFRVVSMFTIGPGPASVAASVVVVQMDAQFVKRPEPVFLTCCKHLARDSVRLGYFEFTLHLRPMAGRDETPKKMTPYW